MKSPHLYINILLFGLFLAIVSPNLFSDGMFMDGLFYAAIARNLAEGVGSFWDLKLAETFGASFHEHPPLAMGLQSVFFQLFGDNILVERIYSLFTYLITGYLIVKIWKEITDREVREFSWVPILFWITVPLVLWGVANNLLENTMMIFTTISIYFCVKAYRQNNSLYFLTAGLSLSLAFLSKGFVGLFPFSVPFFFFLFLKNYSIKKMLFHYMSMLLGLCIVFLGIYLFYPQGIESILTYIDIQVMGSIQDRTTVDSRFFIVWRLVKEIAPMLLISGLVFLITYFRKSKMAIPQDNKAWAMIFLGIGLSGVLPIMVSMKQSGFYILCTFPVFALAIAIISIDPIANVSKKMKGKGKRMLQMTSIVIAIIASTMAVINSKRVGRDKEMLSDIYLIKETVVENEVIQIPPELWTNWSLHGYLQRNAKVSLTKKEQSGSKFFLTNKGVQVPLESSFEKMDLDLQKFDLYRRN